MHVDRLADRIASVEQFVGDVGADDGDQPALADVDLTQRIAERESIVLHALVVRRHAEHEHVAERLLAPEDVAAGRRKARRDRDRVGLGQRRAHDVGIRRRDLGTPLHAQPIGVLDQAEVDRQATHLERVRADQRIGDVLLDVGVHPLDDGDHRHQKGHAHDDAEQREERAKLVRSNLGERGRENVGESHYRSSSSVSEYFLSCAAGSLANFHAAEFRSAPA